MSGGFGGGAVAVAQYFMAKMNHEMNVTRSRLVDGIKFRRAHGREATYDGLLHVDREEFECFYLCRVCGFMSRSEVGQCPSCNRVAWIDLGDNRVAENLRDLEERQRRRVPFWVKIAVAGIYLVIAGITGVVIGLLTVFEAGLAAGLVALPVLAVVYAFTLRLWAVALERLNRKRPTRWRMPLPLADFRGRPDHRASGLAGGGDLLNAPFTGRPCLGYKAMIKFDVAGDARPPEWVLAEVVSSDFAAGGVDVEAERAVIDTAIEQLDEIELDPALDLGRFLRERGLFAFDGEFFLYEARVEPGDPVSVSIYEGERPTAVIRAA